MRGSRVAKRYARALVELAERSQLEAWGAELERLARTVDSPELLRELTSPEISLVTRQEAMSKVAERLELSFPLRSLAVVIARHGRIAETGAIAEAYGELVDEILGRARATITFSSQPADGELQRVVAGLEGIAKKQIIPTVKVDPALLGGAVAELGGKTYDGSLAARLHEARRRLEGQA
ncbi:MAG TPA: ATP synthase F1 subunit delta [Candidatus Binataceae bacterium]|nr:ATP synthase F1 subunit delta [Candidatus Binataceae bacterium]